MANMVPKITMPKTPVSAVKITKGFHTPTSSKEIIKGKRIGKVSTVARPSNTPIPSSIKIGTQSKATSDFINKQYQKTLQDMEQIELLHTGSTASLVTGFLSAASAGAAGAFGQKNVRNALIGTAVLSGLLHGMFSKKEKNVKYRMSERHKGIAEGFTKRAVLGGLGHSGSSLVAWGVKGGAFPLAPLIVSAIDIATLPIAGEIATKKLMTGVSRRLKSRLNYPMTGGEKLMENVAGGIGSMREVIKSLVRKLTSPFSQKTQEKVIKTVDYPGKVVGVLTGEGGQTIADKIMPAMEYVQKIDPLMTQRMIHAIPQGIEGEAARKALKEFGKKYQTSFQDVVKNFKDTKTLSKIIGDRPANREKIIADVKNVYDTYLNPMMIEDTAKQINKIVNDMDAAATIGRDYYKQNERLFNIAGTVLRKGAPSNKSIKDIVSNQTAENLVKSIIEGMEASKRSAKGGALAVGSFATGSMLGNILERMQDKSKSREIRSQQILKKVS